VDESNNFVQSSYGTEGISGRMSPKVLPNPKGIELPPSSSPNSNSRSNSWFGAALTGAELIAAPSLSWIELISFRQFALAWSCIPIRNENTSAGQSLFAADVCALLSPLFVADTSLLYGAIAALASKVAIATVIMATIGSVLLFIMIRKKLLHTYLIGVGSVQSDLYYYFIEEKICCSIQSIALHVYTIGIR